VFSVKADVRMPQFSVSGRC